MNTSTALFISTFGCIFRFCLQSQGSNFEGIRAHQDCYHVYILKPCPAFDQRLHGFRVEHGQVPARDCPLFSDLAIDAKYRITFSFTEYYCPTLLVPRGDQAVVQIP